MATAIDVDIRPVGRPREFDKKLCVNFTNEQWDFITDYADEHGLDWGGAIREILGVGEAAISTGGRRVSLPRSRTGGH